MFNKIYWINFVWMMGKTIRKVIQISQLGNKWKKQLGRKRWHKRLKYKLINKLIKHSKEANETNLRSITNS